MAFRRTNLLTSTNENIEFAFQAHHAMKDVLASGRKHNGPKQAFNELKNIFHNQDKAVNSRNVKKLNFKSKEITSCEPKVILQHNLDDYDLFTDFEYHDCPNNHHKNHGEMWAEEVSLNLKDCDRILEPLKNRDTQITNAEIDEIINRDFNDNVFKFDLNLVDDFKMFLEYETNIHNISLDLPEPPQLDLIESDSLSDLF